MMIRLLRLNGIPHYNEEKLSRQALITVTKVGYITKIALFKPFHHLISICYFTGLVYLNPDPCPTHFNRFLMSGKPFSTLTKFCKHIYFSV